ncbi:MAG: sigma factor-like helix-turn-helix DNA-binding protein [Oscillospiraceae bacterium]
MSKDYKIPYMLDCYGKLLTEKQYTLIDCYYNDDLSLSEIADANGITRQGVRDFVKKAESALLDFEDKLGYVEKITSLKNLASTINSNDEDVKNLIQAINNM